VLDAYLLSDQLNDLVLENLLIVERINDLYPVVDVDIEVLEADNVVVLLVIHLEV